MSYIHKTVLDSINSYRTFLEQNINNLINLNINTANINLFITGEYKLFSIIFENVRMDLNYLLSLNPEYDMLAFPALTKFRYNIIRVVPCPVYDFATVSRR